MKDDRDFVLGPCRCETCKNETGDGTFLKCGV